MKNSKLLFIIVASVFSFNAYSQKEKLYVTDKVNDKYAYVDVIKTYERVAAKGYKSVDLFKKMGDYFYFYSRLDEAAKWYCELFAMTYDLEPKYYYQYAKSLKSIGENDAANEILEKFKQKSESIAQKEFQKQ